jgi:hypothetical protein
MSSKAGEIQSQPAALIGTYSKLLAWVASSCDSLAYLDASKLSVEQVEEMDWPAGRVHCSSFPSVWTIIHTGQYRSVPNPRLVEAKAADTVLAAKSVDFSASPPRRVLVDFLQHAISQQWLDGF